jgi:N-acetylglucosaminyldiphosphoundecaprenol N-acetyl-beta-D-mannosaminyltransferase
MPTADNDVSSILGVRVMSLTPVDLHQHIETVIEAGGKSMMLNVNAHALNLAYEQRWLRDCFNGAQVVFPDGYGAVWAGRMLGHPMGPRVTYADWFFELATFVERKGYSFFFLGGRPGVADAARDALRVANPDLKVVGVAHGYFDHTVDSPESLAVVRRINELKPNVLVVAFGMPLQERWLMEHIDRLDINVGLTGGAVLDYVSGKLKRPPRVLTDHGLEWLGRLIIEPRRLWRRYLLGNPKFVWRVMRQWMTERLALTSRET